MVSKNELTTYLTPPSGSDFDILPRTILHIWAIGIYRGYRMCNHIVVALQWGSLGYALLAIVELVKWRVLKIMILPTLSLGCAHSLSRFSIGTLSLWWISHSFVIVVIAIYPKSWVAKALFLFHLRPRIHRHKRARLGLNNYFTWASHPGGYIGKSI